MRRFTAPLALQQQSAPAAPPTGYSALYMDTTGRLVTKKPDGTVQPATPGTVFAFSVAGTLSTGVGAHRIYNDTGVTLTIKSVRASVGTAPAGASLIVDVNVDGVTIFGTQANRPAIAAGGNTNKTTGMTVTTIADGSYFTVDIDQVGSSTPGGNLTVQVLCS